MNLENMPYPIIAPNAVPIEPIKKINKSLPASLPIFLISHCKRSNGIASGTTYPHTASHTPQSIGIIPKFESIIAKTSAIIAPVTFAAQSYFCSSTIATVAPTTQTVHSISVLSADMNGLLTSNKFPHIKIPPYKNYKIHLLLCVLCILPHFQVH